MKSKVLKKLKSIDFFDIVMFLVPALSFLFYLYCFYPGALSFDSYNQLAQIKEGLFTTSHPFFHTFVEMVLLKIWNNPAIIGLFQIILFSIIWVFICKYNRKRNNVQSMLLQTIISFFIIINPVNGTLSITLWKDVLFSYMVLLLLFLLQKTIDKNYKLKLINIIVLALTLITICNLRHNGLAITLVLSIYLFIMFIIKDRKSFNYLKFLGFLVVFFFSFKGLTYLYDVKSTLGVSSATSIIDNKILMYYSVLSGEGIIKYSDNRSLYNSIDLDCLKYNVTYNYMNALSQCTFDYDKDELYKDFKNQVLAHKAESLNFFLTENAYIWKFTKPKSVPRGYTIYTNSYVMQYKDLSYKQVNADKLPSKMLKSYSFLFSEYTIVDILFCKNATYMYISIILIIIVSIKIKSFKYGVLLLPMLCNLGSLVLTLPADEIRYYYSTLLTAYFIMCLCTKVIYEKK